MIISNNDEGIIYSYPNFSKILVSLGKVVIPAKNFNTYTGETDLPI